MKSFSAIALLLVAVQGVQISSDPICSSAGCTQYKHKKKDLGYKIDYPVPNFGKDHDLIIQDGHVNAAETTLQHTWTPSRADKKDKGSHIWGSGDNRWVVPTAGSDFWLTADDKDYFNAINGKHYTEYD